VDLEERVVPYLEAADLAGQLAGQAVHGPEVAALAMVPARAWRKSSAPVLRSRWRWARGFDLLCCAQEQQRLVALRFHPRQRQSQHWQLREFSARSWDAALACCRRLV